MNLFVADEDGSRKWNIPPLGNKMIGSTEP
jgi:hypothetical protein